MYNPKLNKSGLPQEYKSVLFYPLKLKYEDYYNFICSVLTLNKNDASDIMVLKMSYLKFLVLIVSQYVKDYNLIEKMEEVLSHITQSEVRIFLIKDFNIEDPYTNAEIFIRIGDIDINEWEFEKVKEILLEQNGISMDIVNEYNKDLEEALKFFHRNNKQGDFEEQLFSYCVYMKLPIDVVEETHTFYQFHKMLSRIRLLLTFQMLKPLETSGQISFKDGGTIEDWLSHIPKRGRYDDILVKKESFVDNSDIFKVAQTK